MVFVGLSEQDARSYLNRLFKINATIDVVSGCSNCPKILMATIESVQFCTLHIRPRRKDEAGVDYSASSYSKWSA